MIQCKQDQSWTHPPDSLHNCFPVPRNCTTWLNPPGLQRYKAWIHNQIFNLPFQVYVGLSKLILCPQHLLGPLPLHCLYYFYFESGSFLPTWMSGPASEQASQLLKSYFKLWIPNVPHDSFPKRETWLYNFPASSTSVDPNWVWDCVCAFVCLREIKWGWEKKRRR